MPFLILIISLLAGFLSAYADSFSLPDFRPELTFDSSNGRLLSLLDSTDRENLIDEKANGALWQITMRATPSSEPVSLLPSDAFSFQSRRLSKDSLRLIWTDFRKPSLGGLKVEVNVVCDYEHHSRWKIFVHGLENISLEQITFPRIANFTRHENEVLAVPYWMGQMTTKPRELLREHHRMEWGYPGILSMQCAALYQSNGPGIFLSCNDTNSFRKSVAFFDDGKDGLGFEMVHLPEKEKRADYELPYEAVISTFHGDWFTAAEVYRHWATNQWWVSQSRLAQGINPPWVPKTALWVWNRGRSPGVIQPALTLQKELGLPVSVMWHWWHGCSYDAGFPEYLPPREGVNSFTNAVTAARRKNVNAIVYMNQRLWGMTTASWTNENAERFAVKGADGKIHSEIYNSFTKQPCVSMCMHTPFWRETYAEIAHDALALGVSGIYMDQACSSLACYDPAHGHPIGGGKYWMNGFRLLSSEIRSGQSSAIALAGEGVGESWLPYLDLMLSLQVSKERYSAADSWEPIPFFQAVYHPYVIQYGNYSSLTMPPYDDLWPKEFAPSEPLKLLDQKFSTQFFREQARAFIWGQQPTIANFLPAHLQQRPEEIAFVLRLAKIRNRTLRYLLHGVLLETPEIKSPEAVIDVSRLSIYAGQKGGLTTFQKQVPLVLASAWRAGDGGTAVAVVNCGDQKFDGPIKLYENYLLPKKGRIFRVDEKGRKMMNHFRKAPTEIEISLSAHHAAVFEITK